MDSRLLDILCCPISKLPLRMLNKTQIDALNQAMANQSLKMVSGVPVQHALKSGLISSDSKTVYRIEDDIPVLLADEAITTSGIENFPG